MADAGDAAAMVQFGHAVLREDAASAAAYFARAAAAGDADGQCAHAECLLAGAGGRQDLAEAVRLFRAVADRGDPNGTFWLAHCAQYGLGVPINEAEAARLYRRAADAGHALAMNRYGALLELGRGVRRDIAEAVAFYRRSSDLACPEGMFSFADMLHHGRHVERNLGEAVRLYQIAGDQGINRAVYALCEIFKGSEKPDHAAAAHCARVLADRGEFLGFVQLADVYARGIGVAKDPAKAQQCLARAHAREFAVEQNKYAFDLEAGKGCAQDKEGAFAYYGIAAAHGNTTAMYNLAMC
jgi:TPR repeat protein